MDKFLSKIPHMIIGIASFGVVACSATITPETVTSPQKGTNTAEAVQARVPVNLRLMDRNGSAHNFTNPIRTQSVLSEASIRTIALGYARSWSMSITKPQGYKIASVEGPVLEDVKLTDHNHLNQIRKCVHGATLDFDNVPVWVTVTRGTFSPWTRGLKGKKINHIITVFATDGRQISRFEFTAEGWSAYKKRAEKENL